jgi:hypothetical protein
MSAEAPNQFYHLTLEADPTRTKGWGPCGIVRSWSWVRRRRWQSTPEDQNIPDNIGFGCRDNVVSIATTIHDFVDPQSQPITLRELFCAHPHLQFIVRQLFDEVLRVLSSKNVRCTITKPFGESQLRKISGASE